MTPSENKKPQWNDGLFSITPLFIHEHTFIPMDFAGFMYSFNRHPCAVSWLVSICWLHLLLPTCTQIPSPPCSAFRRPIPVLSRPWSYRLPCGFGQWEDPAGHWRTRGDVVVFPPPPFLGGPRSWQWTWASTTTAFAGWPLLYSSHSHWVPVTLCPLLAPSALGVMMAPHFGWSLGPHHP